MSSTAIMGRAGAVDSQDMGRKPILGAPDQDKQQAQHDQRTTDLEGVTPGPSPIIPVASATPTGRPTAGIHSRRFGVARPLMTRGSSLLISLYWSSVIAFW